MEMSPMSLTTLLKGGPQLPSMLTIMVYVKLDLGNYSPSISPCCCVKAELDAGFCNTICPVASLSVHIIKMTASFKNITIL